MNNQKTTSRGLLYGTVPAQFARLNLGDELFADEFEWEEPEPRFAGGSFASYLMEFQKEIAGE